MVVLSDIDIVWLLKDLHNIRVLIIKKCLVLW